MPRDRKQWRPFNDARALVRSLGLKSVKDYEAWSRSGQRPDDIPGSPSKAYAGVFEGWADFLGIPGERRRRLIRSGCCRPFTEARAYVRRHGLRSQWDYAQWSKKGDRPNDIPANPYNAYGTEWTNWSDWLGLNGADGFKSFPEARAFARSLGLKTRREWAERAEHPDFPADVPAWPDYAYRNDWKGWNDWLGTEGKLNRMTILSILNSLREVLPHLRPAELYAILLHKRILTASRHHTRSEALQAIERLCITDDLETTLAEAAAALDVPPDPEATDVLPESRGVGEPPDVDAEGEAELSPEDIGHATEVPRLRTLDDLHAVDWVADAGLLRDEEILEFLLDSRVAGLWQAVLDGDPVFAPDRLQSAAGGKFFEMITGRFKAQWDGANQLAIPEGYSFVRNGQLAPPNLMQRWTAYRLLQERRLINYSGVGAGKTLSALIAGRAAGAKLTVIVAVNATVENWQVVIANAFPDSVVIAKERGPFELDSARHTYLVFNYESFQQHSWSEDMINGLLAHRIDMVILDEVQSVRLRSGADESMRRRLLRSLIDGAAARNPGLCVLGMSATPVINDLHEVRTLLELVRGEDLSHLPTRGTVPNAILYHQLLTRCGLRHRPNYKQTIETIHQVIDGRQYLDRLRRVAPRDVLGMERAVLAAKLPAIAPRLRRGTVIYTTFVTGVIEPLESIVRAAGFTSGLFTGEDKSGLEPFLRGDVDVLIGSEPIGTGVDGLQKVADQLIFASLPWTSAHYEQVVGRLHRQGSAFEKVQVIVPVVELLQGSRGWSWDRTRLDRIRFKKTLADAAVDGVIPEGKLPSPEEMQAHSLRALEHWIDEVSGEAPDFSPAPA